MSYSLVAAFDIGITNLSICIMEKNNQDLKILKWNIINICSDNLKCCKKLKNGNRCGKIAHYIEDGCCYCASHKNENCKKIKKENSDNLMDYGLNMYRILDEEYKELLLKCTDIIIENQPVKINATIKSIQMILFSYFINKNKNVNLVNAIYKLKINEEYTKKYIGENKGSEYSKRKKLSIIYAYKILEKTNIENSLLSSFTNHKKKDDLADSLLYCYYWIFKKNSLVMF